MPEADVLYSDVSFARATGGAKETTSSSAETTYSEINVLKTQPPAEPPVYKYIQITECLQMLKADYDAVDTNLTERHGKTKPSHTVQPTCPKPPGAKIGGTCLKCDRGWEPHGGTCYYFSGGRATWEVSRDECVRLGGDLVQINGVEEQRFLVDRLREKMKYSEDKFWIGLTDSEHEGRWLWVNGSSPDPSLTFWSGSEPDNWTGENSDGEDCLRMGEKYGARDLKCWFDKSCKVPHKSICEKQQGTGHYMVTCV
ncbi:C-type lectin domain family 4 member E-like isoform X2 [Xiphias gladius]|uniref:C-type lectin domain family 4 member E-like isoform X2 n=1 Tax=Xiphias gladius TaxID=8245 RepID=UPI001A985A8B|nr:C-type lectin domain family 4 member E-like isoform X2 [Xiphias gladius]